MPYSDINQIWVKIGSGKWLVAWQHQAVTWTSVDLSSVQSCGIYKGNFTNNAKEINH